MDSFSVLDKNTLESFDLTPSAHPEGYVIVLDKPYEWTSADAVRKVKFSLTRRFKLKNLKVGHAGTLDPLATGILSVCVGKATKCAESLQQQPKSYIAEVTFGATTPSFDKEKEVDALYPYEHITIEKIEEVVKGFIGVQQQLPPIYSAKYVDGIRAYEMARQGEQVELKSSTIEIYDMKVISYSAPVLTISVECSKGTYIRAIARDLGIALGSGGYLTALQRSSSGSFRIENALSMEDFSQKLRTFQNPTETFSE